MTFSAPKSVSVMAIVGGDERLLAAHTTAVREALEEAEKYSATEASDALRILERESDLKSVSLTEVQRQTNSFYREAIKTMRHSPEEGFAQLEKLGAIREVSIFDRGHLVAELHREFRAQGRDTEKRAGGKACVKAALCAPRSGWEP
jgi:hypothetical protein